jgi:hypothetical protein
MQVAVANESPCVLALRAGRHEACPGADCPLWEHGRCLLEQLGADEELYADVWDEEGEASPPGHVQFRMSG